MLDREHIGVLICVTVLIVKFGHIEYPLKRRYVTSPWRR